MKPTCSIPYLVTKLNEEVFKKEVKSLVLLGFLETSNDSDLGSQYFKEPKSKANYVHFIRDFRNLNKQIKCKHIQWLISMEFLFKLEYFHYSESLDLNMGYSYIILS